MTEKEITDLRHPEKYTTDYLIETRTDLQNMVDNINEEIESREKGEVIFRMTKQELDDFLFENGFERTEKNRQHAIEAFRGWIDEYHSEGNLSSGAEGFMQRILEDE